MIFLTISFIAKNITTHRIRISSRLQHQIILFQPQILAHELLIPLFSMLEFILHLLFLFFKHPQFRCRSIGMSKKNLLRMVKLFILCLEFRELCESGC